VLVSDTDERSRAELAFSEDLERIARKLRLLADVVERRRGELAPALAADLEDEHPNYLAVAADVQRAVITDVAQLHLDQLIGSGSAATQAAKARGRRNIDVLNEAGGPW
jgi:hypothetical protein